MAKANSTKRQSKFNDLSGRRFGILVAIKVHEIRQRPDKHGTKVFWQCSCDCGGETVCEASNLISGNTKSCGCLKFATKNTTHGKTGTPLYTIWVSMIGRCCNPNNHAFADYGGRGIAVCEEWRNSFEAFAQDMGEPPDDKTLDRINNDLGYSPSNCRWATKAQQVNNRRVTRRVEYLGVTKSLWEWSLEVGIHHRLLYGRIFGSGWSVERAFTTPPLSLYVKK